MVYIDFAKLQQDAKGATLEALPVGDYDVEVAKAEATTSQNGKPMIRTTMKVVTGPHERRPVINNFVLSMENPTAVAIFFRHMRCFGLAEEFFAALGTTQGLEPVASALVGRRAKLTLGHRDWQGETRNEVTAVKPYTGAPGPTAPGAAGSSPGPTPYVGPSPTSSTPASYASPTPPQPQPQPQPQVTAVAPTQPQPQPQPTPTPGSAAPVADGVVLLPPQPPTAVPTSDGVGSAPSPSSPSTPATSEPVAPPQPPATPSLPEPPF